MHAHLEKMRLWKRQGATLREIADRLDAEEGIHRSPQSVWRFLKAARKKRVLVGAEEPATPVPSVDALASFVEGPPVFARNRKPKP